MKLNRIKENLKENTSWLFVAAISKNQMFIWIINRYQELVRETETLIDENSDQYYQWKNNTEEYFAQAIKDVSDNLDFISRNLCKK